MKKVSKLAATALGFTMMCTGLTGCSQLFNFGAPQQKAAKPTNKLTIVHRLEDLEHRTADHSTPDAMVYIAPGYDDRKPINLIIYNHGMMTNLEDVEADWKLARSIQMAPANTVLVAPEWAVDPKALSDKAGQFHRPNFFRNMLAEIFSKVPELQNRSLDNDVEGITLTSFSGGLYALVSELHKNGLEDKVKSIALFDSLYRTGVLDDWLKKNIKQLAHGDKQFYNFYFHTYPRSIPQAKMVKSLLAQNGFDPARCMRWDTDSPNIVMTPKRIANRPIVFKYAINGDETLSGHNAVPTYYIPQLIKAMSLKQQTTMLSSANGAPAY